MLTKAMYEGNYKALIQDIVVLKESLIIAAIFTHTKITEEDLPEGDEVRMCVKMDRLFNRFTYCYIIHKNPPFLCIISLI